MSGETSGKASQPTLRFFQLFRLSLKWSLSNRNMQLCFFFSGIMFAMIYLAGNPWLLYPFLCWHHLPELVAFFWIGRYCKQSHFSAKNFAFYYVLVALSMAFILGANPLSLSSAVAVAYGLWLQTPSIAGYWSAKPLDLKAWIQRAKGGASGGT